MQPHQEVTDLRREGRLEEAYSRGYELLQQYPEDRLLANSLGWVLYEKIKNIVSLARQPQAAVNEGQSQEIRQILLEYGALNLSRPDLLFSLLLFQTLQFPNQLKFLPALMKWAGIESFRPEDYLANRQNGNVFESLVEKAARNVGKVAKVLTEISELQETEISELQKFSILLIDKALAKAEVQKPEWLQYNKALLLKQLGRLEEAKTLLLSFVQERRNEFWAWSSLAEIVEYSDPPLALALYAKACLTCNDLNFAVSIFEDLSRLAAAQGRINLARWATDQAFTIRKNNQWRIPESLRELLNANWYSQATNLVDSKEELVNLASDAQQVIWLNCPRYNANFLGTFTTSSGKQMAKFGLLSNGCSQELASPARGLLNNLNFILGEPVTVTVNESEQLSTVVVIEKRQSGIFFDQLERVYGIIAHHHNGRVFIYLNPKNEVKLNYTAFPMIENMESGTAVELICARHRDHINTYQIFLAPFQQTSNIALLAGNLRLHQNGFGFVEDAFVPPELASQLLDGQLVNLVVVKKMDKRKNQLGWRAIAIRSETLI